MLICAAVTRCQQLSQICNRFDTFTTSKSTISMFASYSTIENGRVEGGGDDSKISMQRRNPNRARYLALSLLQLLKCFA